MLCAGGRRARSEPESGLEAGLAGCAGLAGHPGADGCDRATRGATRLDQESLISGRGGLMARVAK
jgi:hypothetical protein